MSRRFVIITDNSTSEQRDAITNLIKSNNLNWWHWFANAWLVVDSENAYTPAKIRNLITAIYPKLYIIVLPYNGPATYAIHGSTKSFPWLRKNWNDDTSA